MSVLVQLVTGAVLVAAVLVGWIGATLQNGGVLERGVLFAGAALLLWLVVRLRRRPA